MRPLASIEKDVRSWLSISTTYFHQRFASPDARVWVVKFIDARFLASFLASRQLAVSATPGFTWGDAVYVTSIDNPYSSMMYGRAGVMGYVAAGAVKAAYDAASPRGIELYQEWIQHSTMLFRISVTTVNSPIANRILRNSFRRSFGIDIVYFLPDQFNPAYVDSRKDRWFAVSDWSGLGPQAPGQRPRMSNAVLDCEWVAIVGEQFDESPFKMHYTDLFARGLGRPRSASSRAPLRTALEAVYRARRSGTSTSVCLVTP